MAQDFGGSNRKIFSEMNASERDAVLQELSKTLRFRALASRAVAYERWQDMDALGERIERDHETIAADLEGAAVTVLEAVRLLSEVEQNLSATRH
ncbi:hypothetical protein GAO09_04835 [Rhizobiales bacterium RZME27]|uniref:Uncharacterized protein n=1 Tax=Endobacterium cereale TaxID=2663029 RepID=A0A6A8A6W7_9HYPH|nr:hypothetical protein [Endobacterium cereale]MEB2846517.1 hypothetical protein [Endobacterium cereale]MQY45390.1 hypothetical protein [Endobacterium cereale]